MRKDLPQGGSTQVTANSLWDGAEPENFFELRREFFTTFPQKVWEFAQKHGHTGGEEDTGSLIRFLNERVGRINGTLSPATVRNWLTKGPPSARSREQVYQLCFALELSVDEADEFFIKAYWDRPFDFKEPYECVYWFCIKNGMPYRRALELRERMEQAAPAGEESRTESTAQIEADIRGLDSEEELLHYIISRSGSFSSGGVTVRREALSLMEECRNVADQLEERYAASQFLPDGEGRGRADPGKKKRERSDDRLLEAIYGVNQRRMEGKTRVYQG